MAIEDNNKKSMSEIVRKKAIIFMMIGVAIGLMGGIMIGMILQQMTFGALAHEVLKDTTLNVKIDLNETLLADRVKQNTKEIMEARGVCFQNKSC